MSFLRYPGWKLDVYALPQSHLLMYTSPCFEVEMFLTTRQWEEKTSTATGNLAQILLNKSRIAKKTPNLFSTFLHQKNSFVFLFHWFKWASFKPVNDFTFGCMFLCATGNINSKSSLWETSAIVDTSSCYQKLCCVCQWRMRRGQLLYYITQSGFILFSNWDKISSSTSLPLSSADPPASCVNVCDI